mgnify:CR=1 FL=1
MSELKINTKCLVGGYKPGNGEPRQIPIIQSTTFKYDTSEAMGKLFDLEATGYFYSRLQNPTCDFVAAKIAELEGGAAVTAQIRAIVDAGIPVCAHIGMTPQSVNVFGGFKVQGKGEENAKRVLDDAFAVQQAGAFMCVLECVPPKLAALITKKVDMITIGIGAGAGCDGQVLVMQDMLAMNTDFTPKFVKPFADIGQQMSEAFKAYDSEVKANTFPDAAHSFSKSDCSDEYLAQLDEVFK